MNSYDKILFKDKNIKFYLYHIIHFFEKEKKSPEFYFFFYEGAFKFLSKNYNININYLFSFDKNMIKEFRDVNEIAAFLAFISILFFEFFFSKS